METLNSKHFVLDVWILSKFSNTLKLNSFSPLSYPGVYHFKTQPGCVGLSQHMKVENCMLKHVKVVIL